jgi:hypothetical protein
MMLDLGNSLGQGRVKLITRVLLLQVFYNRPACNRDRQKSAKGEGGYCRAGGSKVEGKLALTGVNLRLGALGLNLGDRKVASIAFRSCHFEGAYKGVGVRPTSDKKLSGLFILQQITLFF